MTSSPEMDQTRDDEEQDQLLNKPESPPGNRISTETILQVFQSLQGLGGENPLGFQSFREEVDPTSVIFENESIASQTTTPSSSPPGSPPSSPRRGINSSNSSNENSSPWDDHKDFPDLLSEPPERKQYKAKPAAGDHGNHTPINEVISTTHQRQQLHDPQQQQSSGQTAPNVSKRRPKDRIPREKEKVKRKVPRRQRPSSPEEDGIEMKKVFMLLGFHQAPSSSGNEGVFDVLWGNFWTKVEWGLLKQEAKHELLQLGIEDVLKTLQLLPLNRAAMETGLPSEEIVNQIQAKFLIALQDNLLGSFSMPSLGSVETLTGSYKHSFIFFKQPTLSELVVCYTLRWKLSLGVQYIAATKMTRDLAVYYLWSFLDLGTSTLTTAVLVLLTGVLQYCLLVLVYRGRLSPTLFHKVLPTWFGRDPRFLAVWRRRFMTAALLALWAQESQLFPEIFGVLVLFSVCSFLDRPSSQFSVRNSNQPSSLASGSKVLDVACTLCLLFYSFGSWSRPCFLAYAVYPELTLLFVQLSISLFGEALRRVNVNLPSASSRHSPKESTNSEGL